MPEQFTTEREEKTNSIIDGLRDKTREEKDDALQKGLEMLVEDLPENREFYDRMKGLRALEAAGIRAQSDRLHDLSRQAYGALGYDTSLAEKKNP